MNIADEAVRAIVRGAGYRAMRGAPLWLALAILLLAMLFGGGR